MNGRPVNPMTAKIPVTVSLNGKKIKISDSDEEYIAKLKRPAEKQLGLNEQDNSTDTSALQSLNGLKHLHFNDPETLITFEGSGYLLIR